MEPGVGFGNDVLKIAEGSEGVVGGEGGNGGAGGEQGGAAGEVFIEVGGGVGDDADGKVDAGDGLEDLDVRGGGVNVGGVDGTEVAAVEEKEEAAFE